MLTVGILLVASEPGQRDQPPSALELVVAGLLLAVGLLVVSRRSSNAVGPVLVGAGLSALVLLDVTYYAIYALLVRPTSPGGIAAAAATQALWPLVWVFLFCLLPLIFPDGRFLSRRWRLLGLAMVGLCLVPIILVPLEPTFTLGDRPYRNPLGGLNSDLTTAIESVWSLIFAAGALAAMSSLVIRYRSSAPEQRIQIRWVLAAVALTLVVVAEWGVTSVLAPGLTVSFSIIVATLGTIPIAIGIAILRHRLFDLDLVIRRSIVFGVLWLAIVGIYVAIAGALGIYAGQRLPLGATVLVIIVATLLFQPARGRLERLADRIAYGRRASAYEVLRDFGASIERTAGLNVIGPQLAEAARSGLGASWIQVLVDADGDKRALLAVAGEPRGEPVLWAPLVLSDKELGRIECGPKSEGTYKQRDEEVLATLGRQAALAIQNAGLAAELARRLEVLDQQAHELSASRTRLVHAQEDERRRIERDLHDGVQQQLISILASVGLARKRIGNEEPGAEQGLEETQAQILSTIREVRELARGIHPAALADGGLVRALEERVRRLPIEVEVDADERCRTDRFSAEVEGAAYFVVCEALANVMKHAGVACAHVHIAHDLDRLTVGVRDAGLGFDPDVASGTGLLGLRDRVTALGGELRVESASGAGTEVRAWFPAAADG
jgi:signal transduction histidine kinase